MLGLVVSAPRGGYLTTKAAKSLDAGVTNGIALNLTRWSRSYYHSPYFREKDRKSYLIQSFVHLVARERLRSDAGLQKPFFEQIIILLAWSVPIVDTDAFIIQRRLLSRTKSTYHHFAQLLPKPRQDDTVAM